MNGSYIIAEAGVNHNGNYQMAKKMVDMAKMAGVNCIKFQTFHTENLVVKMAEKADYQIRNTHDNGTQYSMLKGLELSISEYEGLYNYCNSLEIEFLSTPFDLDSIIFLNKFHMPFWKIPSGEVTNLPYLLAIAATKKPVVMSTGMCRMDEIEDAINILKKNGAPKITLLHCNTEYPTPFSDVNLRAMRTLKEYFSVDVGYSDHTVGIEIPMAAAAMGATIIEKHFTLDKNMEGPDHRASLEPDELAAMVRGIRNIEIALGSGIKSPSDSEMKNIVIARKSIVARIPISRGEVLTEDNVTTKRPGSGITPMRWFEVLGTLAIRDFKEDELIEL